MFSFLFGFIVGAVAGAFIPDSVLRDKVVALWNKHVAKP